MTDVVLDDATRSLTVAELLDRTAGGSLRLIDPSGAPRGELFPATGRAWQFGTEDPGGDGPRGGMSGDKLRARLDEVLRRGATVPLEDAA